ncbi:hypothetical protein SAMN05421813_13132 [Daejeonella rubra]|uniref:Uncharacterized protein n=2 Tax=Daejeonella rubra TaxID=990371 RepID=A0A1G9XLP0_9SPHI|nr:hypothetical protein SAMN05421813_13132 [Daejeonella rubra]
MTATVTRAQTWNEVFKQKETQKKYLIQQIAAMKLYAGYLKKGYDIANKGINSIKDISKGEFDLHQSFFTSLKMINPAIAGNSKIAQVIAWQVTISKGLLTLNSRTELPASDKSYIRQVRLKVMKECEQDMEELLLVITQGKLEMKDDERINRLDKVYESMKDKYQFTQSFSNQVKTLSLQKEQEERNNEASKKHYGIN